VRWRPLLGDVNLLQAFVVFVFCNAIDRDATARAIEVRSRSILLDEADEDGRVQACAIEVTADACVEATRMAFCLLDERDSSLLWCPADGASREELEDEVA